jgi:succinyl-CoA synthetase alpha subunit
VSILVGHDTKLVVQGITGKEGTFHTLRNRAYGTQVVSGVTPGKGGQGVDGIPVYDTVADAVRETGANTSMIFVPPRAAAESILEAADAGIGLVVCITEGIPAQDEARVYNTLVRDLPGTRLLGPNCPGLISPGRSNARLDGHCSLAVAAVLFHGHTSWQMSQPKMRLPRPARRAGGIGPASSMVR